VGAPGVATDAISLPFIRNRQCRDHDQDSGDLAGGNQPVRDLQAELSFACAGAGLDQYWFVLDSAKDDRHRLFLPPPQLGPARSKALDTEESLGDLLGMAPLAEIA
jgi:hypothetical protein